MFLRERESKWRSDKLITSLPDECVLICSKSQRGDSTVVAVERGDTLAGFQVPDLDFIVH